MFYVYHMHTVPEIHVHHMHAVSVEVRSGDQIPQTVVICHMGAGNPTQVLCNSASVCKHWASLYPSA